MAQPKRRRIPDDPDEFRQSLGDHLDELRTRIIRVVIFLAAAWLAGWYLEPFLYDTLQGAIKANLKASGHQFVYLEVFRNALDPFMLQLRLSFMIGAILTAPFATLQAWGFVKPGLKPKERKPFARAAPWAAALFIVGATFSLLILPNVVRWFASYMDNFPHTELHQEPGMMVFFTLKMMLAFGFGFQLPLVVFIIGKLGLVTPETLMKNWRQCTVGIFTMSMIITPSNDVGSMLMMAIPLSVLFAASVQVLNWSIKRDKKLSLKQPPDVDELGDQ
ncbi:MAG: twin-arginine translocase subunit TatC [Armatimonadetes bacterium]|nr:twin-arginine translocase subunit TatC [Armatimonadota bacterium]